MPLPKLPPTAQQALAPGPKRRSLCRIWVGFRGLRSPDVNRMFPSIVSALPAGVRYERDSKNPVRDPAARCSGGMERGRRQREGSRVPPAERRAGAGLMTCPERPAEGAASRASGLNRPLGGLASTCRPIDSERRRKKRFVPVAGAPLAPRLSCGSAFLIAFHLLCSCHPTIGLPSFPRPCTAGLITSC